MLQVRDLRSGYVGKPVVTGATLEVRAGEVVGILGRNGVGKSTLLSTIMGTVPVRKGSIFIDELDITNLPPYYRARNRIGYVPQGRQIFPRLSVRDNLRVAAVAAGEEPNERVEAVLAEFPVLADKVRARGGSLSGGQQQILAIARALVIKPRLLLLDEPTEGIQPSIIDSILDKLAELNSRFGIAMLLVEQNIEFVSLLAKRVYIMDKGQMVLETSGGIILENKELQHEYLGV